MPFAIQMSIRNHGSEQDRVQSAFKTETLKDQKLFASPSFILEGSKRTWRVEIHDRWRMTGFFGEFSLIDETTGDEYNFTKEIEILFRH